jgi:hypothetical protein
VCVPENVVVPVVVARLPPLWCVPLA